MTVDTSHIDVAALYERETGISLGKVQGIGEKASCKGPCFLCGGTDRFGAFLYDDPPHYHCGVNEGNSCGWHGDAIDLVRKIHGFSFAEACAYLEIPLDGSEYQGALRAKPKEPTQDVAPGGQWQTCAVSLCRDARDFLWDEQNETSRRALAYLKKRGLSEETIKRAGLGYLPEDRWPARTEWGLPELEDKKKLFAPRGWYIPWSIDKGLWRVDVRRHPKDIEAAALEKKPIGKYHKIVGSSEGLYNFHTIKAGDPLIIVESPIDALIGQQEARGFHWIATGGTGGARNDQRWKEGIKQAWPVLLAFDSDQAGSRAFAEYWRDLGTFRWLPTAHDINDMWRAGQNIEEWACAGLEMALTLDLQDGVA